MGKEPDRRVTTLTPNEQRALIEAANPGGMTPGKLVKSPYKNYARASGAHDGYKSLEAEGLVTSDGERPISYFTTNAGLRKLIDESDAYKFMIELGEDLLNQVDPQEL